MIRGFVTIALGGALLVMAAPPAHAEKAPPRPDRAARERVERAVQALPFATFPDGAPAASSREVSDTRDAAAPRPSRRGLSLPHPFRAQVLPEGRG